MRAVITLFRTAALCALALTAAPPALAQDASVLPDRRVVVSRDTDFPGGDLSSIFDTTYDACRAACLADDRCVAFTFNSRSGSCFPKGAAGARAAYAGATSAVVLATDPAVLARAPERKVELAFLRESDFAAARAQSNGMADRHPVDDFTAEDYAAAAARSRAEGDTWNAVAFTGQAVVLADTADLWRTHAEDLLAQAGAGVGDVRDARIRALTAAVNAYLREEGSAGRAAALLAMAQALEETGRGRDSLSALRLAATLSPREDIAAARDRAAAQFGFRIAEHVVESDPASPRICAQFSEPLAEAVSTTPPSSGWPGADTRSRPRACGFACRVWRMARATRSPSGRACPRPRARCWRTTWRSTSTCATAAPPSAFRAAPMTATCCARSRTISSPSPCPSGPRMPLPAAWARNSGTAPRRWRWRSTAMSPPACRWTRRCAACPQASTR
jgi:hypothetical protein